MSAADGTGAERGEPRVLFVDNFDSFTYNLVEYVSEHATTEVLRNTASLSEIRAVDPDAIVISPGPGHPKNDRDVGVTMDVLRVDRPDLRERGGVAQHFGRPLDRVDEVGQLLSVQRLEVGLLAELRPVGDGALLRHLDHVGVTMDVLREVSPEVPTLGVCLGLEAAVYEYGGSVGRAPEPIHGKAFPVDHDGEGVYDGLAQGFQAGRYHSLIAEAVPGCLEVCATTEHDGEELVMGVRHREHPIRCVQFHPESVLTAVGHDVVGNFLATL